MKKVYIAGPYSRGDVAQNVAAAIDAANKLLITGYAVYVPHLNHFWHMIHPQEWHVWIEHDLEWLPSCEIFVRLDGESKGADLEEMKAKELGLRIATMEELMSDERRR